MRSRPAAVSFLLLLAAACADSGTKTTLVVTPSGSVTVSGPTLLQANQTVTWAITGTGSLSGTTGPQTVYHPAQPQNAATAQTATVTATTADGQSASVNITVNASTAPIPGGKITGMSAPASVVYDAQGIPHVFCQADLDCLAVQGFLHAQDRLFEMDFFRRTAEGRLSELLGTPGLSQDKQLLALFATRDGRRVQDVMADALDAANKARLDAYVNGVNAYLAFLTANPSLMPGEYAQLPGTFTPGDIDPWTEKDTLAIARLQQFQLSETIEEETGYGAVALAFAPGGTTGNMHDTAAAGRFSTYVHSKQPISDFPLSTTDNPPTVPVASRGPSVAQPAVPQMDMTPWVSDLAAVNASMREMRSTFGSLRAGAGSNNWVVDGAHSATGKAMVANDPHLSLYYPPLFYLTAMTSAAAGSNLDLAGGSFPGIPGALVGRGKHVGWGVTVVEYDVTDLYLETVNPSCAAGGGQVPCVKFAADGNPASITDVLMRPVQYSIKVRNSTPVAFTALIVPHHGPVISYTPGATTAVSMRWTGHDPTNDLAGFWGLATATAVGTAADAATATTAIGALKNYAVGAQNFVLADDAGHIGYYPHARVPLRPWAGLVDPVAGVPRNPWIPLPGYGSSEWGGSSTCSGTGANAPGASCFTADADLPQAVDPAKGYIATANSDPAGYGDTNTPINNPINGKYLSFDWDDPTAVRYARIAGLLKAKAASAAKVTVDDMKAIQSDHVMLLAKLFNQYLPPKSAVTGSNGVAYAAAFDMMTKWGTDGYDCPTGLSGTSPSSAQDTDFNHVFDSASCLLFHYYLKTLLANVFNDDFAYVKAASGQDPGGDGARQIRAMLYMLGLEVASITGGGTATPPGTEYCSKLTFTGSGASIVGTVTTSDCFTQEATAMVTAWLTLNADAGAPPTQAAQTTKWLWGKYHTLTTTSPASPLVSVGFEAGPFARPGGAFTVDVGNPDSSQSTPLGMSYSHGSNVRFIGAMDPSTSARPLMQLPGVEHDAPYAVFSSTPDLLSAYVQNQYFDYLMNHQVDDHAVSTQGFAAP